MKTLAILLLAFLSLEATSANNCDSDSISCVSGDDCVTLRYICDYDDDCYDNSDEDSALCELWRNDACSRNEVECTRHGSTSCVTIQSYCNMNSPPCEGDLDRRICMMLEGGILADIESFVITDMISDGNLNKSRELAEKFRDLLPSTLQHAQCPPMYTLVGDSCISFFHIGSMSWAESREFCQILGGDLMTFRNVSQYAAIAQHLSQFDMTSDFWIGGRIENATEGWTWIDGSPMPVGSPFWATRYRASCVDRNVTVAEPEDVCFQYAQAPEAEIGGQCASLSFEHFFYMADSDCVKKMSPLCIYMGENNGPNMAFFS